MKLRRNLITLIGCGLLATACASHIKEDEEGNEVKVAIDQVPAAVKDTLMKESGGVAIASVDKQTDDGKTQYEADAMIGGKNYEIIVAEDGTLVSKKLDDEAAEKAGGKDKD